jgi:hypothetical protein
MIHIFIYSAETRDRGDAAYRLGKVYKRNGKLVDAQETLALSVSIFNKVYGR